MRSAEYLRTQNSKLIFVTGGARSGKSAFALEMANSLTPPRSPSLIKRGMGGVNRKCYLATAQSLDPEMEERIARHKAERGADWDCIEEPLHVAARIAGNNGKYGVILLDCLTLWVSNMIFQTPNSELRTPNLHQEIDASISACKSSGSTVIVVSNEVGLGIVPDNPLARHFRDVAGMANQLFAKAADEAYFVVSGIPMKLK